MISETGEGDHRGGEQAHVAVAVVQVPESGMAWRLARELNTNNNRDPGERGEHEGGRRRRRSADGEYRIETSLEIVC